MKLSSYPGRKQNSPTHLKRVEKKNKIQGYKETVEEGNELYFLLNSAHNVFEMCVFGRAGRRETVKGEIKAHWLLVAKDKVELFNRQIALTLCTSIVLCLNLRGSAVVPVNFSTV